MNSTILAIDLGKFNSVLCWYDPDTRAAAPGWCQTVGSDSRVFRTVSPRLPCAWKAMTKPAARKRPSSRHRPHSRQVTPRVVRTRLQ